MIQIMLPAFVASVILVGIHGYLGIHIIARGVIFVDLALAQVAAMGWALAGLGLADSIATTTGLPSGVVGYLIGLSATLIAAAIISTARMEHTRVPQEAIIGVIYVVATAGTILLASLAPRGSEHVEQLLTGSLLWVTWPDIGKTAVIYGIIGVAHMTLRHRFFKISFDVDGARELGWRVTRWDFLFYALFGVVVTSSVEMAGVLVVFSFLVIPAVIGFLFTEDPRRVVWVAWGSGLVAATVGLLASYLTDLPTGPMVVAAFGAALALAMALRRFAPWVSPTADP